MRKQHVIYDSNGDAYYYDKRRNPFAEFEVIQPESKASSSKLECVIKSLMYLSAAVAVSRNFTGGYELIQRLQGGQVVTIIFGSAMGLGASVSPLQQLGNSIDQVIELFKKPTKKTLGILTLIFLCLGIWSGLSFAQMGSTSIRTMTSDDWGLEASQWINILANIVFGMTFASQAVLYTEKIFTGSKALIKELKDYSWKGRLLMLLNALFSALGVYTNFVFGTKAVANEVKYLFQVNSSNPYVDYILGSASAVGPWTMNMTSNNTVATIFKENCVCCQSTRQSRSSLINTIGWKNAVIAFLFALISATPSLEYSIEAAGLSGFGLVLIIVSFFSNIIPKWVTGMEKQYKKQIKNTESKHRTNGLFHPAQNFPDSQMQQPLLEVNDGSSTIINSVRITNR